MENATNQKKNSYGRKKLRINFIDVILALVVVAAMAVLGYIILSPGFGSASKDKECTIQYELEITHLREEWSENVKIGQTMIDPATMNEIGTVVDFRITDEQFMSENKETGEIIYSSYPDFVTMTIVLSTEATVSDIGYNIEGTELSVGSYVQFRLPNFSYSGVCKVIETIESTADAAE